MNALTASTSINTLFNPKTGVISQKFKTQLEIVNIVSRQFFTDYDLYHIINVNETLERKGCFQIDHEFYKKGGISNFKITYLQAVSFLEDEYKDRETVMPRENKIANGICVCGVEATMHKRFYSLKKSLEQGFKYDVIHFIAKDHQDKSTIEKLLQEFYRDLFHGIKTNIIMVNTDQNIFEKGLHQLSSDPLLSKDYIIITDPTFAPKVELIATLELTGKNCLGIASAAIQDWKIDMNLYSYEEALGSHEKATIAWASSAWNFKARQVNAELKTYKITHLL